jgi:hypothetical protein
MGGRALKTAFTRRYSREEFETVSKELIETIENTFVKAAVPLYFSKKETFGDIDIIVRVHPDSMDAVRPFIESNFKPTEIFHNGNAYSFDYKEVQVDLICVPKEDFMSNYHYLAFNDLGNYIGRLAQSIGFKYGQEGLWYNHFSDANTKTTIMVSKNYPEIFEFLGLDYARWEEGFDTLEDIFEYAMTSSLFNVEMFQLSKLNKINRERNIKRASYMAFLEYIEGKPDHPEYNSNLTTLAKEDVIRIIREAFPEANVDVHLAEIEFNAARKKLINTKFNGKTIKEKYGLEGKELGEAIKGFKLFVGSVHFPISYYDFDEFVIATPYDGIYKIFEENILNERVT